MKKNFLKLLATAFISYSNLFSFAHANEMIINTSILVDGSNPNGILLDNAHNLDIDKITILDPGNISIDGGVTGVGVNRRPRVEININTASNKGIIGNVTPINIVESQFSLHLSSGKINSAISYLGDGSVVIELSRDGGTNQITLEEGTEISNDATSDAVTINYNTESRGPDSGDATLNINNSGTIRGTNTIYFHDPSSGSVLNITNNSGGIITAGSAAGTAIEVTGENLATINNYGQIIGGINLGANSASRLTISGGSLNGAVTISTGQIISLESGATISGSIDAVSSGRGVVNVKTGTQTINSNIGSTSRISQFNLESGSKAVLAGDVYANSISLAGELDLVNSSGNNLAGTLSGSGSGTLNLNSYSHTLNGDLTLTTGDIISTAFSSGTDSFGNLTVDGVAVVNSGVILNINLTDPNVELGVDTRYLILSGQTGSSISAVGSSNLKINNLGINYYGNYTFTTSTEGNSLYLNVIKIVTSQQIAQNQNQLNAYNNITSLRATSGNLSLLQDYFFSNSHTNAQKAAVLKSTISQNDNSINRVAFDNINNSANLIGNRLFAAHLNKAAETESKKNSAWGEVFGINSNQGNNSAGFDGYKVGTAGFILGFDKKIDKTLVLGVAGVYSSSQIKSSDDAKTIGVNNYQLNFYSSHNFEKFFVNNIIGLGYNEYSSNRYISFINSTASAKYDGQTYMARSEIGSDYKINENSNIRPTLSFTAASNSVSEYSEGGAGNVSLSVKNSRANFFESRAGVLFSQNYSIFGKIISPSFSTSYGYDFIGDRQKSTNSFVEQSSSFALSAAKIARSSARLGAGIKIYDLKSVDISANYGFENRGKFNSNSLSIRAKYSF